MGATRDREQRLLLLRGYAIGLGALGLLVLVGGLYSEPRFLPLIIFGGFHLFASILLWRAPLVGWVAAMIALGAQVFWPIRWILEMTGAFPGLEGFGKVGVVVFSTLLICVVLCSGAALLVLAMLFPGASRRA